MQRSGCGLTTMTAQTWPWVDSHPSSGWPWLHNVSTSTTLAKGEDYPPIFRTGLVTAGLSLVFVPTASDRRKFEIFANKIKGVARQLSELISSP